jgi:poly-gamma-glutamate synthesis protein (capsule biosynthesis protein)
MKLRAQAGIAAVAVLLTGCAATVADYSSDVAQTSTAPSPGAVNPAAPSQRVTLAFAGDVHFAGVDGARLARNDTTAIGPAGAILSKADVAMVNLETAVTTRGTPAAGKQYVFRAPATAFVALKDAGIDVATEANNHGEDYGRVGVTDSIAAAKAAHFAVVGIGADSAAAYAPDVVTVHGERIAFLAATQVVDTNLQVAWTATSTTPGLAIAVDPTLLLRAVRAAKAAGDLVVVYVHWGVELQQCPTAKQKTLAEQLATAGADVIVGSHAHVLQGAGFLGTTYVDYGLGNFYFYTGGGGLTGQSGVLTLQLDGRKVTLASWSPAAISNGQPLPLTGKAASSAVSSWRALRACTGLTQGPTG